MSAPPSTPEVRATLDGHVVTVVVDRPAKLNAMTPEMARALVAVIDWTNTTDTARVLVLTGAGDRAFSVGSDVAALDGYMTPWDFRNRTDYCDALRRCLKPTIAAINGYALGGGLETALSCDVRLASDSARLGAPEIKLGWIGGGGMSAFLAAAAGPSNAALMLMTGDPIDASRAASWNLVSEVVRGEELMPRAQELAATIASRAPIAAETAKANLRAAASMPEDQALAYERDLQTICFATEDAAEGRRAFAEKRPPVFRRR